MKNLLKKAIHIFLRISALFKRHIDLEKEFWINRQFSGIHLKKSLKNVNIESYKKYKYAVEAEHQIGRFLNMKKVLLEVEKLSLEGDIVEFGTWEGDGLILFDMAIDKKTNKKLIGIDSFEGLPESSTIWSKGTFSNNSRERVHNILKSNLKNFSNFELIQGWFDEPKVANDLYEKINDISIVHLDADLGSSTKTALQILERYMHDRKLPIFLLFDDWGCHPDEVPDAFYSWLSNAKFKYNIKTKIIATTNKTRYYKLSFMN